MIRLYVYLTWDVELEVVLAVPPVDEPNRSFLFANLSPSADCKVIWGILKYSIFRGPVVTII